MRTPENELLHGGKRGALVDQDARLGKSEKIMSMWWNMDKV